ncbi:hypothetical protein FBB35_13310 [Nostoc sp. TCL240-02]|nr:hypothetical protein [Nostoc sp. TCL240-02]QKQ74171.1 hypothetical protein FBB35_13310 [Nostoc sp. TCL240-02]
MLKDLIFCLQEAALYLILIKKSRTPQDPSECFVNSPCGCANPGQDIQCEDCAYLESCLSNCKLQNISLFSCSHTKFN